MNLTMVTLGHYGMFAHLGNLDHALLMNMIVCLNSFWEFSLLTSAL